MKRNSVAIGLALGLAVASSEVAAKDTSFEGTFSGTVVSIEMDLDGDGVKNALLSVKGKSNLGAVTIQGPSGEFVSAPAGACPAGYDGFMIAPGTAGLNFHFEKTGDLLFEKDSAFTECVDPNTGSFFGSGTGTITGGTGQFAGATGSFAYTKCTGETLFFEQAPGDQGVFSLTCKFTGTIKTTE